MIAFLDLTALAVHDAGGPGLDLVRAAIEGEETLAMATLSKVHMAALLGTFLAEGVPHATVQELGRRFLEDEPRFVKVPTDVLVVEAMILAVRHHLQGDQALQVAAALHLEQQILRQATGLNHPVAFVTLDPALAEAARTEGLRVPPDTMGSP